MINRAKAQSALLFLAVLLTLINQSAHAQMKYVICNEKFDSGQREQVLVGFDEGNNTVRFLGEILSEGLPDPKYPDNTWHVSITPSMVSWFQTHNRDGSTTQSMTIDRLSGHFQWDADGDTVASGPCQIVKLKNAF